MTTIKVRRGTAAQWASAATVLAAGEPGLDTTNNILKLGDGSTAWASLNPVLNNTYAAFTLGVQTTIKPSSDSYAGTIDWVNDSSTGYLFHLHTGANSAAAAFAIGIGVDQGSGGGMLISNKSTGGAAGLQIDNTPGTTFGLYLKSYALNAGMYLDQFVSNSGGISLRYRTGAGFPDGVTTQGSTTLTSATATFVSGDNGATLSQLASAGAVPDGVIPTSTTITFVNSTTVTLSQAATATVTGLKFLVSGRAPSTGQTIIRGLDTDGSTELWGFRQRSISLGLATVAQVAANDTTRVSLAAKQGSTSSIDPFQIQESGGTAHIRATKASSSVAASFVVGKAALATNATDGFLYLPTVAGTPTGTPTSQTGTVPVLIDTTGSKLWARIGGAWVSVTLA